MQTHTQFHASQIYRENKIHILHLQIILPTVILCSNKTGVMNTVYYYKTQYMESHTKFLEFEKKAGISENDNNAKIMKLISN